MKTIKLFIIFITFNLLYIKSAYSAGSPPVGNGQYFVSYRIIGQVYFDENNNGEYDPSSEDVIEGLRVTLRNSNNVVVSTLRTQYSDNSFVITGLHEGRYCISIFDDLRKYTPIMSGSSMLYNNGSYCFDLNPRTTTNEHGQVFKYIAGFRLINYPISIITWNDINENGLIDHEEPYLSGIHGVITTHRLNGPIYAYFNTSTLRFGHGYIVELTPDVIYCIALSDPTNTYKVGKQIGINKFNPNTQSTCFYMKKFHNDYHIPAALVKIK